MLFSSFNLVSVTSSIYSFNFIWWLTSQSEKQSVWSVPESDRKPCSDQCYLQVSFFFVWELKYFLYFRNVGNFQRWKLAYSNLYFSSPGILFRMLSLTVESVYHRYGGISSIFCWPQLILLQNCMKHLALNLIILSFHFIRDKYSMCVSLHLDY